MMKTMTWSDFRALLNNRLNDDAIIASIDLRELDPNQIMMFASVEGEGYCITDYEL